MFRVMKWLCCCERCWSSSSSKEEPVDDDTTLVTGTRTGNLSNADQIQPFYVPRRHSSYNTGSFSPVYVQPRIYNSDSCSSSADEDTHPTERGRCWSTVAATTPSEVAAFVAQQQSSELSPTRSYDSRKGNSTPFERHALEEIAEMEPLQHQQPDNARLDDEPQGNLLFTTTYDEQEQKLTLFLDRATDLPVKGTLNHYDTFVKFLVSSSRKNYRVSRPIRKTLNPSYDEEFVIPLSRAKWKATRNHFLRLSVFDNDRQGRHDAVGHVTILISKIIAEKVQHHNLPLMPMTMPIRNIGQLLVGLSFFPTQSRLLIHVIKGRHLRLDPDVSKYSFRPISKESYDTFVKITLMCGGQKVKTSKSEVVVDSTDPLFSYKSNFVVPPQFLLYSSIVVSVVVKGVLGRNVTLGRITAGPYTEYSDGSYTHWGKMLQDGRSVMKWRNLYL